jgi:hypothetical protein
LFCWLLDKAERNLWGKFPCHITLYLESQRIGTLAYCHQDYFLALLLGNKGKCSQCNFHGQEIISERRKTSFSTLQFPKLGEVAPLCVLLVLLDLQSIYLCFIFCLF